MKALTVKQPWASLIVEGVKDIENRTWKTKFRGRILVHAGAKPNRYWKDIPLVHENYKKTCELVGIGLTEMHELMDKAIPQTCGAIIGLVEIVDCVQNHPSEWAEKGVWNWVLRNPMKFPEPIKVKGKLSLWDYPYILAEPEEKDGKLFCHCQLGVDLKVQVQGDSMLGNYCRYCGGRWYR